MGTKRQKEIELIFREKYECNFRKQMSEMGFADAKASVEFEVETKVEGIEHVIEYVWFLYDNGKITFQKGVFKTSGGVGRRINSELGTNYLSLAIVKNTGEIREIYDTRLPTFTQLKAKWESEISEEERVMKLHEKHVEMMTSNICKRGEFSTLFRDKREAERALAIQRMKVKLIKRFCADLDRGVEEE
jgi:hypothetical protein